MFYGFSFKVNLLYALRMDIRLKFLDHSLYHNDETGYFDAAASASGTGTAEHQQEESGLTYRGPGIKVNCGETGTGHQGRHLKSRICQSLKNAGRGAEKAEKDDSSGSECNDHIVANFLHQKSFFEFAVDNVVVCVKIDAKKKHKYCYHPLEIGGISCHAVVFDSKSASSGSTEAGVQGIKKRHFPTYKKKDLE